LIHRGENLVLVALFLHERQVVVGEGGVAYQWRQDVRIRGRKRQIVPAAGNRQDPEDVLYPLQRHAEEGLGSIFFPAFSAEAIVVFDILDEERGLVDYGEFGDALGKIDAVAALQLVAVADGGMDDKVIPFSPLEDEDGADVAVDQFHRPLQGDVEQIV